MLFFLFFFFSSRRRHTRSLCDWSSDVCSSDLVAFDIGGEDSTDHAERKLAAIFAADVEGYSRLMGIDEVGTLRTLTAYREIIDALIAEYRGRIFNTAGDSVLAEFPSVVDAVQCAVELQRAIGAENGKRSSEQ